MLLKLPLYGGLEDLLTVDPHLEEVLVEVHNKADVEPLVVWDGRRIRHAPRSIVERAIGGGKDVALPAVRSRTRHIRALHVEVGRMAGRDEHFPVQAPIALRLAHVQEHVHRTARDVLGLNLEGVHALMGEGVVHLGVPFLPSVPPGQMSNRSLSTQM